MQVTPSIIALEERRTCIREQCNKYHEFGLIFYFGPEHARQSVFLCADCIYEIMKPTLSLDAKKRLDNSWKPVMEEIIARIKDLLFEGITQFSTLNRISDEQDHPSKIRGMIPLEKWVEKVFEIYENETLGYPFDFEGERIYDAKTEKPLNPARDLTISLQDVEKYLQAHPFPENPIYSYAQFLTDISANRSWGVPKDIPPNVIGWVKDCIESIGKRKTAPANSSSPKKRKAKQLKVK